MLFMGLMALGCISCSDDDDNAEPSFTPDGKRLVAKIREIDDDATVEVSFQYDKNARLEKFIEKHYYDDEEENSFTCVFSYSNDKITAKSIDKYVEEGKSYTDNSVMTFTLNDRNDISEYKWIAEDRSNGEGDYEENGQYVYDSERQLTKVTWQVKEVEYTRRRSTDEYNWSGGIMVSGTHTENGYQTDSYAYSYSDVENKTNIDWGNYFWRGEDWLLNCFGYLGRATSKYYPLENKENNSKISYKYTFDDEEYPVQIEEYRGSKLECTYVIEYK